jgi:K+-sensing histidine kinase KdpD
MSEPNHGSYVDRVREDTQKYVRRLLSENEQLRLSFAQVESELGLKQQELTAVREELEQRRRAQIELARAVERIREESQQYAAQYAEVEMHNANLANLYVASYQLHGTLSRDSVLEAMTEIVVNLVGSEEFAICEIDEAALSVLASVGIEPDAVQWTTPHVRAAVESGDAFIGTPGESAPGEPLVCLPLKLDGKTIAVVIIFRLLAHKSQLEALDHELFDLLATHAATALYCTSLHEWRVARLAS